MFIVHSSSDKTRQSYFYLLADGGAIYSRHFKRLIEVSIVLAATPLLVPVILLMCMLVAIDGHSPFFRQQRIGINGKPFGMWKIRTMIPNAEEVLSAHLATNQAARQQWADKQKLLSDPRCTKIGRFLRRTSLDELPQVLNVLVGEMALVGPRPILPTQRDIYNGRAYFHLRPGITGVWQVTMRNDATFDERIQLDELYAAEMGLLNDLSIIVRTIAVVFRGTGH